MLAKALTCAVVGLDGAMVEVEVDIGPGLPAFNIVGLPDAAVQEAKERVRAAIKNSACVFPQRRITVNLAPADLKKEGPALPTGHPEPGPPKGRVDCLLGLHSVGTKTDGLTVMATTLEQTARPRAPTSSGARHSSPATGPRAAMCLSRAAASSLAAAT